ncbi:hypothetical protein N183_30765 [Sinorhizobium sp. Sb3]|nr:hypothetical protein N183_30765 [Sinorhizobium sp. Sb3]
MSAKVDGYSHVYRAEDPSKVRDVKSYAEANGGMSRYEKFRYFERHVFKRSLSEGRLGELCSQYRAAVEVAVASARFIDGALEAITRLEGLVAQHVVSAAPEDELEQTLTVRGIRKHFKSIGGAPKTKLDEFRRILSEDRVRPNNVLAIGDSLSEYRAASELKMPFLAIVPAGATDRFPDQLFKRPDLVNLVDMLNGLEDA